MRALSCSSGSEYRCVILIWFELTKTYRYSTAEAWAPQARKLLSDYGEDVSDSI